MNKQKDEGMRSEVKEGIGVGKLACGCEWVGEWVHESECETLRVGVSG